VAGPKCKKVKRQIDATRLYVKAKNSVLLERRSTDVDDAQPDSTQELLEQLVGYEANVRSINKLSVYVACMMGRNLAIIHQRYKDNKEAKSFFDVVHEYLPKKVSRNDKDGYSTSQLYFYMSLHKLAFEYNKVMYISANILGNLKSQFSGFSELVKLDGDWWNGQL
jgi:hypothetical protein